MQLGPNRLCVFNNFLEILLHRHKYETPYIITYSIDLEKNKIEYYIPEEIHPFLLQNVQEGQCNHTMSITLEASFSNGHEGCFSEKL